LNNTNDSVAIYLQKIARIKLLTKTEEITLARQITDLLELEKKRDSLKQSQGQNPKNSEWAIAANLSVKELLARLSAGRAAKNQMIQANLRLVVFVAKRYLNKGLLFQDLIQEGTLGLIKATEKFDFKLGYKFNTYAIWWIKHSINRAIENSSRTIRLPSRIYQQINLIKRTGKTLRISLGRIPTEIEIANGSDLSVEQLRFIKKSAEQIDSIDRQVGENKNTTIVELIAQNDRSIEENLTYNLLLDDLHSALDSLSKNEAAVLRLRYGIDNGQVKTVNQVGQMFQLSPSKVRQIETLALRKLRHPQYSKVLKQYIS